MTRKDDRQKHIERIKALRNKTTDRGCTEEEFLSAAQLADELMDKYGLEEEDLRDKQTEFDRADFTAVDDIGARMARIATAIATLTGVQSWSDNPRSASKITFLGFAPDVEVASYLYAIADRAVRTAVDDFEKSIMFYRSTVRHMRRVAFIDGMIQTIALKINSIAWTRQRSRPSGVGLVLLKDQLIAKELHRRGINLDQGNFSASRDLEAAFSEGKRAADQVQFEAGVATGKSGPSIDNPEVVLLGAPNGTP